MPFKVTQECELELKCDLALCPLYSILFMLLNKCLCALLFTEMSE